MPHYNLPHNHGQNIERVLDNMPSAEGFQDISFLFQQLGDFKEFYKRVHI